MASSETDNKQQRRKHALSVCSALIGAICATPALAQTMTTERLSLFATDGLKEVEDRPIPLGADELSHLNLSKSFTETTSPSGDVTWTWQLKNMGASDKVNLRFTAFLDADLSAATNTFFNESGDLINLNAPALHIASDRWEVGELGYFKGDLLSRAVDGRVCRILCKRPIHCRRKPACP